MNFQLDEDTILLRDSVRELGKQTAEAVPQWEAARALPTSWFEQLRELGLLGMRLPEAQGGAGLSTLAALAVLEELAACSASAALSVAVHEFLGLGAAGHDAASLCESVLGHAAGLELDGDVLRGEVTPAFGGNAVTHWVATAQHEGVTRAFVLDAASVEFSPSRTLGLRAASIGTAVVDGTARSVGDAASLLKAQQDWTLALGFIAAGIGRAALAEGVRYASEREQFGRPIAKFQAIQWKLADLSTGLDAAELMLGVAAGREDAERGAAIARATVACVELVTRGSSDMLQIHGGYGYTEEFAIERHYRDARAVALYAGVRDSLRSTAAQSLLARFAT